MFGMNPSMAQRVQENSYNVKKEQQMLDGIKEAAAQVQYDPIGERVMATATANMRMAAMSIVLQTALILDEGQDEDNEMLPNELLDNLTLEAFSEDGDDDDDDIDPTVKAILSANIADAFSSLGVDDGTIDDLFSTDLDVADTAIESACATVVENLPADGEPLDEFVTAFVFGWDDDDKESGYDSAMFDNGNHSDNDNVTKRNQSAVKGKTVTKEINGHKIKYKGVMAMRHGHMTIVNKRIAGQNIHLTLTSGQKDALRKARIKATSVGSVKKQMRSFAKGLQKGIYGHLSEKQVSALQKAGSGRKQAMKSRLGF